MERYNYQTLSQIIGNEVTVTDDKQNQVILKVVEVFKSKIDGDQWEAFSVMYQGDETFHIPQGTYLFQHEIFGERSLFVSPKSATTYETVVNRKKSEAA